MKIVVDTAKKMNVSVRILFDMWACFETGKGRGEAERAYMVYRNQGRIGVSLENFCLNVLTGRAVVPSPFRGKKGGRK